MPIVDAQVHIWAANTPERPWPEEQIVKPHRPEPFSKDNLLEEMNAAGVQRAVLVTPMWEGFRNDLVLEAAQAHPDQFAVMGRFEPELPASRGQMATWREQVGMLGLRLVLRHPPFRPILSEGLADWLWAEAEQAGVPIMLLVDSAQLKFIDQIAERHPGLKLVVDHLCISGDDKDEEAFKDLDMLLAVAKRPNIAVKATSLPQFTSDNYPYTRIHPYLRRIYDAFGPKRIFWGSDLSHLYHVPCSYSQVVTMFTEEMSWLTEEDKNWIMGHAICEWLGWQ